MTFAYQWVRCGADGGKPDGSNCTTISGATGTSYVLTSAEVGSRIRARVTATNSSGSQTAASNPTDVVKANAPVNSKGPTIAGSMVEGQTASVNPGTWSGAAPITFTYQWLRCNSAGGSCVAISRATAVQYKLTSSDVGRKLRVNVTGRNSGGSTTVLSSESAVVQPSGPAGVITLPSGEKSIPVTSVPKDQRLIVDRVIFTPSIVRSRRAAVSVQVRVKDTRGFVVRDALVYATGVPFNRISAAPEVRTDPNGWATITYQVMPTLNFDRTSLIAIFVRARKPDGSMLAGVSTRRLVSVRVAA
jgi:hypothetical protein